MHDCKYIMIDGGIPSRNQSMFVAHRRWTTFSPHLDQDFELQYLSIINQLIYVALATHHQIPYHTTTIASSPNPSPPSFSILHPEAGDKAKEKENAQTNL